MARQGSGWRCLMNAKLRMVLSRKILRQLLNYILVGALTNLLGYTLYIFLTYLWGAPKLTMTLLYFAGALTSFFANRRFTFRHSGYIGVTGVRYLVAHLSGYLMNLTLLLLFVDWLGFPHQIVQAIAIIVVAIWLFVLLRVYVFATYSVRDGAARP